MAHQGYGFCEFLTEEDAEYACKIMNQIKLWGKPIRVNKVSTNFFHFISSTCHGLHSQTKHIVVGHSIKRCHEYLRGFDIILYIAITLPRV